VNSIQEAILFSFQSSPLAALVLSCIKAYLLSLQNKNLFILVVYIMLGSEDDNGHNAGTVADDE
jgi:hypothetical protein